MRQSSTERRSVQPLDMLIDQLYRDAVGYIVSELQEKDGAKQRLEIGTVFFVKVNNAPDDEFPPGSSTVYAVTARHVISVRVRDGDETLYLRINMPQLGNYGDFPIMPREWIMDDSTDVAVLRLDHDLQVVAIPLESFISDHVLGQLLPGYGVFMIGLFYPFPGEKTIEPIVRFGNLSLPRIKVGIHLDEGKHEPTYKVDAHLIETHSWGGHSGSPVFVFEHHYNEPDEFNRSEFTQVRRGDVRASQVNPPLLGLLHGHHKFPQSLNTVDGQETRLEVHTQAGIAVVIPAARIQRILMQPILKKEREAKRRLAEPNRLGR